MEKLITWSYGGGTQSIAIAVLIAQGKLPTPDIIVFADTGREATETWEWMYEIVQPYLARTVHRAIEIASHSWATVDTYSHKGELLMPVYTANGKLSTFCSSEWKKLVIHRYLRSRGVEWCDAWLGMSTDELSRLKPNKEKWITNKYPLCLGYGIAMNRMDCRQLVESTFSKLPPKSACFDCPHRCNPQWLHMKTYYPDNFKQAVARDYQLRAEDIAKGQSGVWLHEDRIPLDQIDFSKPDLQMELGIPCESGMCFV